MTENFNPDKIKLIIGLGNPGREYVNTYHNVGFLFLDHLANNRQEIKIDKLKTDSYMNVSGNFVRRETKKRNLSPENILIVQDDTDLLLGTYKFSFDRGAAGHKGTASIIQALKTKKFWRLRIGVRPKGNKNNELRIKAGDFVLKKIKPGDKKAIAEAFAKIGSYFDRSVTGSTARK